jgi:uncharacterized protein (DUF952 family)
MTDSTKRPYPRLVIYKLLAAREWAAARARGHFAGSADDLRDGFVHLSGRDQVVQTAARHFADATDLVLLTVDPERVAETLRWEPAPRRDGLFPHVYGVLPVDAVVEARPVPAGVPVPDAVAALLGQA